MTSTPVHRPSVRRLVATVAIFVVAITTAIFSYRLGLGSFRSPGPGLWPMLVSVGLFGTATAALFTAEPKEDVVTLVGDDDVPGDEGELIREPSRGPIDLVVAVVSLLVFVVAFERLGMVLPTFALLLLWVRFLGRESWLQAGLVALGITAGIWLIFVWLLALPLPTGILGV